MSYNQYQLRDDLAPNRTLMQFDKNVSGSVFIQLRNQVENHRMGRGRQHRFVLCCTTVLLYYKLLHNWYTQ